MNERSDDAGSTSDSTTRRRCLGSLGTGAAAAVAGCAIPFLGGSGSSIGGSGPVPSLVANWVPAGDRPLKAAEYTDHAEVDSVRDSLPESFDAPVGVFASTNEEYGFEETLVLYYRRQSERLARCRLKTGSIDTERVDSVLDEVEYDSSEERGEFTVYRGVATEVPFVRKHAPFDLAVSPEYLVSAPSDFDPVDLTTLLDTYAGEATAATASDGDAGSLLQTTGGSTFFRLELYEDGTTNSRAGDSWIYGKAPESNRGYVETYDVRQERIDMHLAFLFPDAGSADRNDFESYLQRERPAAAYEDTSVSTHARVGVVGGSVPTERFNYLWRKETVPDDSPIDAQFRFQPDDDSVLIRLSYKVFISGPNRGEPVMDSIVIEVDGEERHSWESGQELDSPWTVSIERGDVVSVTGEDPEGTTGTVRYHA